MFNRILFATDFTQASTKAEAITLELARKHGAAVIIMHVIERVPHLDEEDETNLEPLYKTLQDSAASKLEAIHAVFAAHDISCSVELTIGARWQELVDAAERQDVDLIVIGGRPLDADPRLSLGTTGHKVFLASNRPVLIARAETSA